MNSQNASVSLRGRGGSGFDVVVAGDVNGVASGEVTRGLGFSPSFEHLAAFGERFDAIEARRVTDAGRAGNLYRALRRDFHFRLDDVFAPVAAAGRDVAGQGEVRQRRHGDVVCAADAGFQHASAPDGNGFLLAVIVDAAGGGVSADAAQFQVDDLAGADFDRGAGVLDVVDAFVEADGSVELALQGGMGVDVVVAKGLLDHDQVEGVELFQQRRILQAISGIGVHHQAEAREFFTEGAGGLDIVARLDFYFDALVSGGQFLFHFGVQGGDVGLDADRNAAGDFVACAAE